MSEGSTCKWILTSKNIRFDAQIHKISKTQNIKIISILSSDWFPISVSISIEMRILRWSHSDVDTILSGCRFTNDFIFQILNLQKSVEFEQYTLNAYVYTVWLRVWRYDDVMCMWMEYIRNQNV